MCKKITPICKIKINGSIDQEYYNTYNVYLNKRVKK